VRPARPPEDTRRPETGRGRTAGDRPGERPDLLLGRERAVSDLVGFVLVFSLVAAVVAVVSVAGLGSLQSARDAEQTRNAERALEVLADNMADIRDRGAPSRATEISLDDASIYLGDRTVIEVRDPTGSTTYLDTVAFNARPVVYDDGNSELVYALGAVFRVDSQGGTIIESWDPVIDENRTVIPIMVTTSASGGPQAIQSDTVLVRGTLNRRTVQVADDSYGDTGNADVWINVTSSRHELWERMLSDNPDISCPSPNPDPNEVQCQLDYSSSNPDELYVVTNQVAVELQE